MDEELEIVQPFVMPKVPISPCEEFDEAALTQIDDLDLDFEEISDGELEEEARIRCLGDALGVDWTSLVEESKAISREKSLDTQTSAKQRWTPHAILLDVGISHRYAGKATAIKLLIDAQRQVIADQKKIQDQIQDEIQVNEEMYDLGYGDPVTIISPSKIKEEEFSVTDFCHPVARIQVRNRLNAEERKNLIFNATGPYSRALSARADLQMRRVLCGLSKREIIFTEAVQHPDPVYAEMALELFNKSGDGRNELEDN